MLIKDVIKLLNLKVYSEGDNLNIEDAYTSDLLSIVIANAPKNSIWITVQKHINIVAVASLKEISAIIITEDYIPEEVIKKAKEEKIWLLGSKEDSFTASGKIFKILQDEKIHD